MIPVRFRLGKSGMMMTLDVDKYLPYLDGCDMTLEQKVDCINALEKFAQTLVDVAWDFDPNSPTHVCTINAHCSDAEAVSMKHCDNEVGSKSLPIQEITR